MSQTLAAAEEERIISRILIGAWRSRDPSPCDRPRGQFILPGSQGLICTNQFHQPTPPTATHCLPLPPTASHCLPAPASRRPPVLDVNCCFILRPLPPIAGIPGMLPRNGRVNNSENKGRAPSHLGTVVMVTRCSNCVGPIGSPGGHHVTSQWRHN